MAKWHFASAVGMPGFGLNDAGMESFRGAPVVSLAREICQNSTDALTAEQKEMVRAGEPVAPVRIEFCEFEGGFPDAKGLITELCEMESYYKVIQKKDKKVLEFIRRAIKGLSQTKIRYLRISDFNTTGLRGIDEIGTPWDNLIMSDGNSDKDVTDGGSKGIGHSAAFVNTDLQVVFYHSLNIDGKSGAAGVARLVSRRKLDKSRIGWAGIGFYGNGESGMESIPMVSEIGESFVRSEPGTDIYIAGFNKEHWQDAIVCSAVDSFLVGFKRNRLILDVAGKEVSGAKLKEIIGEYAGVKGAFPHHADQYYCVLTSSDTQEFVLEIEGMGRRGRLVLKLKVDLSLTARKIAMVRDNGMLIFEKDHISTAIPFAGVLEVEGAELNGFLRALENPQHTEWRAERASVEKKDEAIELLGQITRFCKDSLRNIVGAKPGQKIDSGLGSLDNPADVSDAMDGEDDINDEFVSIGRKVSSNNRSSYGNRKCKKRIRVAQEESSEFGCPAKTFHGQDRSGNVGNEDNSADGSGESPTKWTDVEISNIDYVCVNKAQSEYEIQFVPKDAALHGRVKLFAVAETENYCANVIKAKLANGVALNVQSGNVIEGLEFVKNDPVRLFVQFDYADYCSLEVETYGSN